MRIEVVAIGTELLLGQIVDTNSSWIGAQLAAHGLDTHYQTKVGDNLERIVGVLNLALERSDAVICCGGLGPTQDDITREAIAKVMGVDLIRDEAIVDRIRDMFSARGRVMAENNARQGDVPVGATVIAQTRGTAPALICPVQIGGVGKVIYAVPGVPHEMEDYLSRVILGDLVARSGEQAVIGSRTLRTWGAAESSIAELVAPCLDDLDKAGAPPATIAFLASGIEGIKVRVTAKAANEQLVREILDEQEKKLRNLIGQFVFGIDGETMEFAVGQLLLGGGDTLAVAESLTGGLISSRLVSVVGASKWFRGAVVSYASDVKFDLLGVESGPVVSESAAIEMARGVAAQLNASVGLSATGVAGPDPQDGQEVGTVFIGLVDGDHFQATRLQLPGDRDRIRQFATISAADIARKYLLSKSQSGSSTK